MSTVNTNPPDEVFPLVDENNNVIGQTTRRLAHKSPNEIHRAVYVLVINPQNQVLIQKRSKNKDTFPGCWDLSVGGHIDLGENYFDGAIRESKEEIGLTINKEKLSFVGEVLVTLPWEKEFFHVFEYRMQPEDKIVLAEDEVESMRYMTIQEINMDIEQNPEHWSDKVKQIMNALYIK